jgi:predicted nuclease of restriction endonuclease-like (RecB) superfamily
MNYDLTLDQITPVHQAAQSAAARTVDHLLTMRNGLIGAYLVEYEQNGEDRAVYGEQLLKTMAGDLARRGLRKLSETNLKYCRTFAIAYPAPAIRQTVSDEFGAMPPSAFVEAEGAEVFKSLSFPSLAARHALQPPLSWQNREYYTQLFRKLSWSQLLELARLDDPLKRAFYELECMKSRWSQRELKRQINSLLYERIGLSKDKDAVMKLAREGQLADNVRAILRDPVWSESDLETALIAHLQKFLHELGRDFCFVARQFRIMVGGRHHHLDLLFYHRALRCLLAVDLKLRPFQHEDAGQMNFYLNYLKEEVSHPDENPPVGLILCTDKDAAEVHYATAGMDRQLFVSRYLVALPSEAQLKRWLLEEREQLQRARQ